MQIETIWASAPVRESAHSRKTNATSRIALRICWLLCFSQHGPVHLNREYLIVCVNEGKKTLQITKHGIRVRPLIASVLGASLLHRHRLLDQRTRLRHQASNARDPRLEFCKPWTTGFGKSQDLQLRGIRRLVIAHAPQHDFPGVFFKCILWLKPRTCVPSAPAAIDDEDLHMHIHRRYILAECPRETIDPIIRNQLLSSEAHLSRPARGRLSARLTGPSRTTRVAAVTARA